MPLGSTAFSQLSSILGNDSGNILRQLATTDPVRDGQSCSRLKQLSLTETSSGAGSFDLLEVDELHDAGHYRAVTCIICMVMVVISDLLLKSICVHLAGT